MSIPCFCSHCGARIHAPDKAAGRKAKCPKCGATTVVPALPDEGPTKGAESVIEDLHREAKAPQVAAWEIPPPVRRTSETSEDRYEVSPKGKHAERPVDRGALTDSKCYDCGRRIYEKELVRRDVVIYQRVDNYSSHSSSIGGGAAIGGIQGAGTAGGVSTWGQFGSSSGMGVRHEIRRVDLCATCDRKRTEAEAAETAAKEEAQRAAEAEEDARRAKAEEDKKKAMAGCGIGCLALFVFSFLMTMISSCNDQSSPHGDKRRLQQKLLPEQQAVFHSSAVSVKD